jgi:hypothetical protein
VALLCSDMDFLNPFLGTSISFVNSTQWSHEVKDDSLSVSEICSPSKVISNQFSSPREIYFVVPFPVNDTRRCWS